MFARMVCIRKEMKFSANKIYLFIRSVFVFWIVSRLCSLIFRLDRNSYSYGKFAHRHFEIRVYHDPTNKKISFEQINESSEIVYNSYKVRIWYHIRFVVVIFGKE